MEIHLSQAQIDTALPGLRRVSGTTCGYKRESPIRMASTAIPSFAAASTGPTAFGACFRSGSGSSVGHGRQLRLARHSLESSRHSFGLQSLLV
jgi:hypothetical protein